VKSGLKIGYFLFLVFVAITFFDCRKNKITPDPKAKIEFSQDSVLFDTVFTTIGSATQNIRIRNKNNQAVKIRVELQGGSTSPFIINVDGQKGISFSDIEIAANDSIYVFIQVNVNPTNANTPVIISDAIHVFVNGNTQTLPLEAWGQDAYYHFAKDAVKFKDGSYFTYSTVDTLVSSYTQNGKVYTWKNDKPHVIYGYLVVDSLQKLIIPEGTKVYMNYRAGVWVLPYGEIQVLGTKGKEVVFQGARREKDYADEPGQWDRIWINEGSDNNVINYAIIKNGFVGVQAEVFGNTVGGPGKLRLTNTKIQNMSKWGLFGLAYKIDAGNTIISNCQEHSLNILYGGQYFFYHCAFTNFWEKDKAREKPAININNYTPNQILPNVVYFGNCIIDGKRNEELNFDTKTSNDTNIVQFMKFNNCWIKTTASVSDATRYYNVRTGTTSLKYKDLSNYKFEPETSESRIKDFDNNTAKDDARQFLRDIEGVVRNTNNPITIGAYYIQ
jgi:hypothetical protein